MARDRKILGEQWVATLWEKRLQGKGIHSREDLDLLFLNNLSSPDLIHYPLMRARACRSVVKSFPGVHKLCISSQNREKRKRREREERIWGRRREIERESSTEKHLEPRCSCKVTKSAIIPFPLKHLNLILWSVPLALGFCSEFTAPRTKYLLPSLHLTQYLSHQSGFISHCSFSSHLKNLYLVITQPCILSSHLFYPIRSSQSFSTIHSINVYSMIRVAW